MTNEELVEKIRSGEDVEKNTERLYLQIEDLISKIASNYASEEDFDDLKQEGYFGFITALELWRPDGGASFSTYAFKWIRQAMRRYIENNGSLIRLPSYQHERIQKYKSALGEFLHAFNRDPTPEELSAFMGIDPGDVDKIREDALFLKLRSIDATISQDDDSLTLGDMIRDDRDVIGETIEGIQAEELSLLLWPLVDSLGDRESQILRKRYIDGLSLQNCGEDLGISLSRVYQIENKAIKTMRKPSIRKRLEPFLEEKALSIAQHSTGLGTFQRTWTSAPERAVLFLNESK